MRPHLGRYITGTWTETHRTPPRAQPSPRAWGVVLMGTRPGQLGFQAFGQRQNCAIRVEPSNTFQEDRDLGSRKDQSVLRASVWPFWAWLTEMKVWGASVPEFKRHCGFRLQGCHGKHIMRRSSESGFKIQLQSSALGLLSNILKQKPRPMDSSSQVLRYPHFIVSYL